MEQCKECKLIEGECIKLNKLMRANELLETNIETLHEMLAVQHRLIDRLRNALKEKADK